MQYRSILTSLLLTIATVWLGSLLWDNINQLKIISTNFSYWRLLTAIPFAVLALYTSAITYHLILIETTNTNPAFGKTFISYLGSQIVRYLPGKIWGIIYQANKMRYDTPAHTIWETNLTQFILGNLLSAILISWAFMHRVYTLEFSFLFFITLIIIFFITIKTKIVHVIIRKAANIFPLKHHISEGIPDVKKTASISISLAFEWLFYFMSWIALIYPTQTVDDIIILSIVYVAAWLVGFATIILPGGVLVRESAFISLGMLFGFDAGVLAFYAILARVLFSSSDIFGVVVAHAILKQNQTVS